MIVTLDDTTAIFATLVVRDLNPDVDVLVRANESTSVREFEATFLGEG